MRQLRDGRGVPQLQVDPQEGGTREARLGVRGGLRALDVSLQRLFSVRRGGPAGDLGQGHAANCEHCAHLLAPVGVAEDTVSHSLQSWQVCGMWEARTRARGREARGGPTSGEGGPGVPAGGRRHGAGSHY